MAAFFNLLALLSLITGQVFSEPLEIHTTSEYEGTDAKSDVTEGASVTVNPLETKYKSSALGPATYSYGSTYSQSAQGYPGYSYTPAYGYQEYKAKYNGGYSNLHNGKYGASNNYPNYFSSGYRAKYSYPGYTPDYPYGYGTYNSAFTNTIGAYNKGTGTQDDGSYTPYKYSESSLYKTSKPISQGYGNIGSVYGYPGQYAGYGYGAYGYNHPVGYTNDINSYKYNPFSYYSTGAYQSNVGTSASGSIGSAPTFSSSAYVKPVVAASPEKILATKKDSEVISGYYGYAKPSTYPTYQKINSGTYSKYPYYSKGYESSGTYDDGSYKPEIYSKNSYSYPNSGSYPLYGGYAPSYYQGSSVSSGVSSIPSLSKIVSSKVTPKPVYSSEYYSGYSPSYPISGAYTPTYYQGSSVASSIPSLPKIVSPKVTPKPVYSSGYYSGYSPSYPVSGAYTPTYYQGSYVPGVSSTSSVLTSSTTKTYPKATSTFVADVPSSLAVITPKTDKPSSEFISTAKVPTINQYPGIYSTSYNFPYYQNGYKSGYTGEDYSRLSSVTPVSTTTVPSVSSSSTFPKSSSSSTSSSSGSFGTSSIVSSAPSSIVKPYHHGTYYTGTYTYPTTYNYPYYTGSPSYAGYSGFVPSYNVHSDLHQPSYTSPAVLNSGKYYSGPYAAYDYSKYQSKVLNGYQGHTTGSAASAASKSTSSVSSLPKLSSTPIVVSSTTPPVLPSFDTPAVSSSSAFTGKYSIPTASYYSSGKYFPQVYGSYDTSGYTVKTQDGINPRYGSYDSSKSYFGTYNAYQPTSHYYGKTYPSFYQKPYGYDYGKISNVNYGVYPSYYNGVPQGSLFDHHHYSGNTRNSTYPYFQDYHLGHTIGTVPGITYPAGSLTTVSNGGAVVSGEGGSVSEGSNEYDLATEGSDSSSKINSISSSTKPI